MSEEGDVDLRGTVGDITSASFSLSGQQFIVVANLSRVVGVAPVSGNVTPSAANASAASAEFSSDFGALGGDEGAP